MATKKREVSSTGFYHVFQRGVNHFDIFEDDEDRAGYLERLKRCADEHKVDIHAWCLMSNHVHVLVKADMESLSAMMRCLGSSFARYFNRRHGRSGPLFGGRFCSVCVETDEQYLTTIRYIHRNPVHHDASALVGGYRWSSYTEHLLDRPKLCDIKLAEAMFGSKEEYVRFHMVERDYERHIDLDTIGPMGDDEARLRASRVFEMVGLDVGVSNVGSLARDARNKAVSLMRQVVGCSMRQIQRLTALAYSSIQAAVAYASEENEALVSILATKAGLKSGPSAMRARLTFSASVNACMVVDGGGSR